MNDLDLSNLLPHEFPALMVVDVERVSDERLIARGRIEPSHPLVANGEAPTIMAMEFAAQAGGVLMGLIATGAGEERNRPSRGFLVSLKDVRLERVTIPAGRIMTAEVFIEGRLGVMAMFAATVTIDGEIVASGRFAVAEGS